jgi:hypothetical protein
MNTVRPFHSAPQSLLRRALVALGVLAIALFAAPVPAQASNWAGATGLTGCGALNKTENSATAVSFPSVSSAVRTAATSANTYITSASDVAMSTTTSTVYDDIRVFDAYYLQLCGLPTAYGNYTANGVWAGVIGMANCMAAHSSSSSFYPACDRHYVYIDQSVNEELTAAKRKYLLVHEFGHALGLKHRTTTASVMYEDPTVSAATYDSHDIGHLNAAY